MALGAVSSKFSIYVQIRNNVLLVDLTLCRGKCTSCSKSSTTTDTHTNEGSENIGPPLRSPPSSPGDPSSSCPELEASLRVMSWKWVERMREKTGPVLITIEPHRRYVYKCTPPKSVRKVEYYIRLFATFCIDFDTLHKRYPISC